MLKIGYLKMRNWAFAVAVVLGCSAVILPAETNSLTSLAAIHRLTNAEASKHLPVEFEATVTYYRDYERTLFVQDGDAAIYIRAATGLKLRPGDRVQVRGTTDQSFRPIIGNSTIERLGHGEMPKAVSADFRDLMQARFDCRLVTVRALIRTADVGNFSRGNSRLQMLGEGGAIEATLDSNDADTLKSLLDAEVEVTGVASGRFDGKMQQTGILLHITSLAGIKVLKHAQSSPWSLPVRPMDQILNDYQMVNQTPRIRVQGTITYYQPGSAVVLQNGSRSLWIKTEGRSDLRLGDVADATGIPDVHDGFLTLTQGTVEDTGAQAPVLPRESTWSELSQSHHLFDLVSIQGKVVVAVREAVQDEYTLLSEGHLFSAIIRHPATTNSSVAPSLPPMKQVAIGSTVHVTGVCILEDSNPFDANVPFNLMMRSYDDIAMVARPSWVTERNLLLLVSVLLVMILAVTTWGWTLRTKVRRQTAVLAARAAAEAEAERKNARFQQQRSRILEDINGVSPLVEVLERITEFVSVQLNGAPCWCEIVDGARVGRWGASVEGMRIASAPIPCRSGASHGTLFAALNPKAPAEANEGEAFFLGAQLATLAIENRRMYSDLVHRSEFDLLTDIHNRFSLDKQLDALIARARDDASVFGLIYIDLDEFKQVNDVYGHRIGDLYLKEVSLRMKRQLRSADLLARLGGDEFAVLVPLVHNRSDVQEITQRLERCFDAPLSIEAHVLHGSASVGFSLYPEDGLTRDSLLSAADAAMYVAKHVKRANEVMARANETPRSSGSGALR
jgi:diguanylate cyclase (GGDEF)-like protein